ncbi:MAG: phosphotransferase family protein [Ardenticatenaceae bacterium]
MANGKGPHYNVLLFGVPTGQSDPIVAAKICRSPAHSWTLRTEYTYLTAVWQMLGLEAKGRVPYPLALGEFDNNLIFLMEFCEGRDLLPTLHTIWDDPHALRSIFSDVARALRYLHNKTINTDCPGKPMSNFASQAAAFQLLFKLTDDEVSHLEGLANLIAEKNAAAQACILIQGDFWPSNIIQRNRSEDITLIDWQSARWSPDASQDVYLFPLTCSMQMCKGVPEQQAANSVRVLKKWQTSLLPAYLAAYGAPEGYSLLPVREGLLACCVEMATRSYLSFGLCQADGLLWHRLFSELCENYN